MMRPSIAALPPHVPMPVPEDAIRLAANEVPYGPLPGVEQAIGRACTQAHRYPDWDARPLREALAGRLDVHSDRIAVGCGLTAVLEHLVRATCGPGDELLYAWPSFEAYPVMAASSGVTGVPVAETVAHGHDLAAMARAITDRTRLVLICNPNNPTGTALRSAELRAFLDQVPPDVVVAFDEAYREFVTDPQVPDGQVAFGNLPNVVVLRTMSKAWGMAGLRVGYLLGSTEVASAVRKLITPFSVNAAAQAGALAALGASAEMSRRVALIAAERNRLVTTVRRYVPATPISQANFIWLPLAERAAEFSAACRDAGILVRAFSGVGVRVTVGRSADNDAFLAVLAGWADGGASRAPIGSPPSLPQLSQRRPT